MRRLSSILDHESLLDAILDAVIPLTGAQRALVLLQQGTQLEVARGRDVSRESLPSDAGQISLTLARRCMAQNELLEFDELSTRPDLREIKSIQLNQLFSAVCVPLRKQNQPFGVLYLDSSLPTMTPTPGDREMLEAFAAQASVCLVNADLIRELENSKVVLTRENQELIAKVQGNWRFASLIGRSEEMQKLFERLRLVKDLDLSVVLIGESGTGKELVAQALHSEGARAKQSFVPVNCGAIPANLFESEFFGHVRGAFTGANVDRPGLVEQADHGTLFLDEIGDMPIEFQPKLLRFLESGEYRRVGETRVRKSNVRVISATHRDLRKMADEGTFRADLFYRLDGVHVDLPSLRERRVDIPILIEHFFKLAVERFQRAVNGMTNRALQSLLAYPWPGNVRQLRHAIEGACALVRDGESLDVSHLQLHLPDLTVTRMVTPQLAEPSLPIALQDAMTTAERQTLTAALDRHDWNITRSAKELGISRQHLHNRIRHHGLERPKG